MNAGSAARAESYTLIGGDGRPYTCAVKGTWGGHSDARIYGRLDCPTAVRAIARGGYVNSRVFFADEATAVAAGYRPCGACCKERYREWRIAMARGKQGAPDQSVEVRPRATG